MPTESRNILRVFLASPRDVLPERQAARGVIDNLNKVMGQLNWRVELVGWEDTLPGAGRPQELINRHVDACDLFIGIVWKRWGTPPGEGKYTSGVEEEYKHACERCSKTSCPEIWIIFKRVEDDQLADPGEQLQKVLAFKKEREALRDVFFRTVESLEEWKTNLREWLEMYILDLYKKATQLAQPPTTSTSVPLVPTLSHLPAIPEPEPSRHGMPTQLTEVTKAMQELVNSGVLNLAPRDGDVTETLDKFHLVRFHLLSAALMSRHYTNELFGAHEINLLYHYREKLVVTLREYVFISRTLVGDYDSVRPGWYWFRKWDSSAITDILFYLAIEDENPIVQAGAFDILKLAQISPPTQEVFSALSDFVPTASLPSVRMAGLAYFGAIGTKDYLSLIEKAFSDKKHAVRAEAVLARFLIIDRNDPNEAFSWLLNDTSQSVSPEMKDILETRSAVINRDLLIKGLQHPDPSICIFSVRELIRRHELSKEQASALLNNSPTEVQDLCYAELIRQGVQINLDDVHKALEQQYGVPARERIILTIYRSLEPDALRAMIDWYSVDGPIAYRVMATTYFSEISDRIRLDLNDRFQSLEEESIGRLVQSLAEKVAEFPDSPKSPKDLAERIRAYLIGPSNPYRSLQEESTKEFIRARYAAAALGGLAGHGEQEDIDIARKYLKDSNVNVQLEAIRIIARFGDATDVDDLLDIARRDHGELGQLAARTAMKLAPGFNGAARRLLETQDEYLIGMAIQHFLEEDISELGEMEPFLESLLENKKADIRSKALVYFAKRFSQEDLQQLLSRYLRKMFYYYDVVCWLDRILYAPSPLKEMFRRRLEATLPQQTTRNRNGA